MPDKKYLDSDGLLYFYGGLKGKFVSDVTYNTTTHKFEKTKNGSTTEIITATNLKTEMGLNNVGNFKAVSTEASQGLTEQEKANARANIGAGSSGFSGSFNDLTDVPTTLAGYGITDALIANGVITIGANSITPLTQHQDISGKADVATTLAGYGITDALIANGVITLGANSITPLTQHQDISGKADKATTLAGYGITDAYISNGTITLGSNSVSISGVYRYKGSVATYSALPATAEVGDVYNVESDGKNYAYTGVTGALWDDLGGSFTIVSITNSEIDTILAS